MKKTFAIIISVILTIGILGGCTSSEDKKEKALVNAVMLKGPTGVGAVKLMEESENKKTDGNYNITIAASPDEITGKMLNGEVDIAAVPTNLASVLYNKTEGEVSVIAVNTLGVLYVLENGNSINSISDLSGKTVYSSGKGAVPEYVFNHILKENGVTDAEVIYVSEHAEAATALLSGNCNVVLLPEPNVTAVTMKNDNIRIAIDITEEWDKISENDMAMGCVIVRNEFLKNNREAVEEFIDEYEDSIEFVNENIKEAAVLVEKFGIMASAAAAEKAIPNCNICFIDGYEMKAVLEGFYEVLYEAQPKSIGGKLPEVDFYLVED